MNRLENNITEKGRREPIRKHAQKQRALPFVVL